MRSGGVFTGQPQHRSRPEAPSEVRVHGRPFQGAPPFLSHPACCFPSPLGGGGRTRGMGRGCGCPALLYFAVWLRVSCFPTLDFSFLICKMGEKGNVSNPVPLPTDRSERERKGRTLPLQPSQEAGAAGARLRNSRLPGRATRVGRLS